MLPAGTPPPYATHPSRKPLRQKEKNNVEFKSGLRTWGPLIVALGLINAALTFASIWPTFGIRLTPELSVEAAVLLLALAAWQAFRGAPSRGLLIACSVLFVLLVVGHYAAVMSHSLYGRDINLYWDTRHVANVTGMFVSVTPVWILFGIALAAALLFTAIYLLGYWSFRQTVRAMTTPTGLRVVSAAAVVVICLFVAQRTTGAISAVQFTMPVTEAYAQQVTLVKAAVTGRGALDQLGPAPDLSSGFTNLGNTDVLVMFLESYGAVTYDRPDVAAGLVTSRKELASAIEDTGRTVVSAFANSPTFAGGSWLAHLSFMSGIQVRDPGAYDALMTQQRDTLASLLAKRGYRTVGLMPGIRLEWPEGAFYKFNALLDSPHLDYRGPEFGWWRIPDQFALAKFDELEFDKQPRAPLFLLFTSINTHLPFLPTPPYQPDWQKLLSDKPFAAAEVATSLAQQPGWYDMGHDYAQSMAYAFTSIAGYLRKHNGHDLVLVVLGDHQPAANVSGEDASWEVPVHIIADRPELIAPLLHDGFQLGLTPARPSAGDMNTLLPMITKAMDGARKEAQLSTVVD